MFLGTGALDALKGEPRYDALLSKTRLNRRA